MLAVPFRGVFGGSMLQRPRIDQISPRCSYYYPSNVTGYGLVLRGDKLYIIACCRSQSQYTIGVLPISVYVFEN